MTPDHRDLRTALEAMFKRAPEARYLIAVIETEEEGPPRKEQVTYITTDNVDQIADSVAVADQLLRHVGDLLGSVPADDWSRERMAKIETARAALDFEKRPVSA